MILVFPFWTYFFSKIVKRTLFSFALFKSHWSWINTLYIPISSHPASNKRAFIKGELMRYARNSWNFTTFANLLETAQITRLSPPFFASAVSRNTLTAVNGSKTANVLSMVKLLYLLHTTAAISISRGFNIQKYLPEVKCIISYKSTKTLASLCK